MSHLIKNALASLLQLLHWIWMEFGPNLARKFWYDVQDTGNVKRKTCSYNLFDCWGNYDATGKEADP